LGVRVDGVTFDEALARCLELADGPPGSHVVTVNPEFVVAAGRDPAFRDVLNAAALALPDAVGVVWAARWLGVPFPERVAGADLAPAVAGGLGAVGRTVFLLGAAPGVAELAAATLEADYGARCAGTYAGSPRGADFDEIATRVRQAAPAALFVAFGAPAQDLWIHRYSDALGVPLMMGVGGTLDFLAGRRRRAPRTIQRAGFEWLWRLVLEPWRWRRQLALPRFAAAVCMQRLRGQSSRGV
jgi:N-acetylglucosaminyldiphosphoundecaprenol N-acetyl-beta-D-mannosaminyltransferase